VNGYPSKPIGLYSKQSIIFRSDSNAEDLEGYAGDGFYDRFVLKLNFLIKRRRCTPTLVLSSQSRVIILKKEAHVECLKEKKLFKDTAAKLKADNEKAFESDNGEVGDRVT
ncbi:unnamed protein product, partial [Prunus brigantina]